MKNIGYVRTFAADQDIKKNKSDILKLAQYKQLGHVHFVEETFSGKLPWREREIANVVGCLRKGDSLLVSDFSQLGHTTRECMEILSVAMQKGINVYSVKNNWNIDQNIQLETAAMAFSMALEIDRDISSERTKEALRVKKASGASLGRPRGPGKSKLDPFRPEIITLLKNGSTKAFIADRFRTTPANLSNWMKKHGITRSDSKGECEETNRSA